MKVRFFAGPLDGATLVTNIDLPSMLIFPEHDSWGLMTQAQWEAMGMAEVAYRLNHIVPSPGVLPEEAHYLYDSESA